MTARSRPTPRGDATAKSRRTQRERSAETTAKILEATIDLLHDRGLHRMSTSDVAEHAGLSRGALSHHFSSKEEIVVEAVARQLTEATAGLHAMAADIRRRGGTTDDIVDYLWRMMTDRLFYVTMEYLPEARHNPGFRAKMMPVVKAFHEGLDAVWAEIATQSGIDAERAATWLNSTMCLLRGMVAQSTLKDDPDYFAGLLVFWKNRLREDFAPAGGDPGSRSGRRVAVTAKGMTS